MLFPNKLSTRFRSWADNGIVLMQRLSMKIYLGKLFSRSNLCYITHFLFVPVFVKLTMVYNFDRGANASAWRNKQPRKPAMSMAWRVLYFSEHTFTHWQCRCCFRLLQYAKLQKQYFVCLYHRINKAFPYKFVAACTHALYSVTVLFYHLNIFIIRFRLTYAIRQCENNIIRQVFACESVEQATC